MLVAPLAFLAALLPCLRAGPVEAAAKPAGPWKTYATRTLADLPAVAQKSDADLDTYGGLRTRRTQATGFFHPAKIDGRWWLVDPEGGLFLYKAVASVSQLRTPGAQTAFKTEFGSDAAWAAQTTALLREQQTARVLVKLPIRRSHFPKPIHRTFWTPRR